MSSPHPLYPVAEIVPHAGNMILIDEILDYDEDMLVAQVTIRESSLFLTADNVVPAWVGIEYMAQAIAAWAGLQARLKGEGVMLGYLLGTRHYQTDRVEFLLGETLKITVTRKYQENDLGVFDCEIQAEQIAVQATLNVYQPR